MTRSEHQYVILPTGPEQQTLISVVQTQIWPVLHSALMDAGLRSISTEEVRI
jgi:hypothetical protein